MSEEENNKREDAIEEEVLKIEQKRREKEQIGEEKGVFAAEIVGEMEQAFIDYAMSVIVDRALPSVEDGLKPVHRRILYAMSVMGLDHSKPTRKCAKIVGETMGNYHPHGNLAIYDALVRMAQDFSLRYPLIHGQGNFGNMDGDSPAADRYCVTGDSLIITENGLEEINKIANNEDISLNILSKDKKINKASKWFDSGNHETIKITTNKGYSITGTKNHPLLTLTKDYTGKPAFVWKTLENIKQGDFTVIDRREDDFWPENELSLVKYWPKKGDGHQHQKILPHRLDNNLAFILGALVSEGSISENKIEFCNTDEKFIEEFEDKWKKTFPDSLLHKFLKSPSSYGKKDYWRLECHSRYTIEFLRNIGLLAVKSNKKTIPFSLFKSPKHIISHFLKAYFEGDGCIFSAGRKIELNCSSISKKLLSEIQIILLRFGIESKIRLDIGKNLYKLIINGKLNIFRFYKNIGFSSIRKSKRLELITLNYKKDYSATDYVPFISDFVRGLSHDQFIIKHNFDRYSSMKQNYEQISQILLNKTKEDHSSIFRYLLTYNYLFEPIVKIENAGIQNVYSIKVESNCHSFISNGFISHNTEAKLSKISAELLEDIEKDTVKMRPNFSNDLKEPETLPAKLPNLLLNGATGIAVGMATNIPPHNLTEISDAVIYLIENPKATVEDLIGIVKGPDFPTGGLITGPGIKEMYRNGKGKIIIRAKSEIEEDKKGKTSIIIKEIPYMVNKADLVKNIAQLATEKKLPDISDLRDESARGNVRIVIELKKGTEPKFTLNQLYKMTNIQTSFDANLLALVGKQPRVLNLLDILGEYIKYRQIVVRRRSEFDLNKAQERLELVLGLLLALKDIDAVVALIRKSQDTKAAHEALMNKFKMTDRQAKAVLEIRLQQLTHLEADKLKEEENKLKEIISGLEKILGDEKEILKIIKREVNEIKTKFGDERRTKVIRNVDEITEKDLVEKKDVVVMITNSGYIKRVDLKSYKEQKRGGVGVTGADLKDEDFVTKLITCSTHDHLLFFTSRGRLYWLKSNEVPASERQSKGKAIVNLLDLRDETIANVLSVSDFDKGYLMFVTKLGIVKKIAVSDVAKPRSTGVRVMNMPLDGSDVLISVMRITDNQEVLLTTSDGKAIRFNADEVRQMGRASYGVKGIELNDKDEVVSLVPVPIKDSSKTSILTVTNKGYGKRSALEDYRLTGRGGKGVINLKPAEKNGEVVRSLPVTEDSSIIATTKQGMIVRISMDELREMGRATQGVRVVKLKEGDKVADVVLVADEEKVVA